MSPCYVSCVLLLTINTTKKLTGPSELCMQWSGLFSSFILAPDFQNMLSVALKYQKKPPLTG